MSVIEIIIRIIIVALLQFVVIFSFFKWLTYKPKVEDTKNNTVTKQCPKCGHSIELTQYYTNQSTFSYDCANCKGHITVN